jgi:CheY-like chemotaxis protein
MGPRAAGPAGPAVLVVEDDPGVAALLADVLAGAGYAPATTDSALGAAALARRLRPAAVLLDLGLPYRSGGALLDDLKADPATAGIPVLMVSALADAPPPTRRRPPARPREPGAGAPGECSPPARPGPPDGTNGRGRGRLPAAPAAPGGGSAVGPPGRACRAGRRRRRRRWPGPPRPPRSPSRSGCATR